MLPLAREEPKAEARRSFGRPGASCTQEKEGAEGEKAEATKDTKDTKDTKVPEERVCRVRQRGGWARLGRAGQRGLVKLFEALRGTGFSWSLHIASQVLKLACARAFGAFGLKSASADGFVSRIHPATVRRARQHLHGAVLIFLMQFRTNVSA